MPEFLGGKMRPFGGRARAWKKMRFCAFLDCLTLRISVTNESRVQTRQNFSVEVLMMSQTCLNFWGTRFGPWMDAHLKKKLRFCAFRSKNQNKSKLCRFSTKLCRPSRCIFIEVYAKNQIKIRFLGRCFDFLVS